jgi:outer membrane lipase/esterase
MLPASSHALSYDAEYVFGDSLSDTGNLAETGILQARAGLPVTNFPNPPSNHDSFTNGPVAVQVLANDLGLNANPSLWVTGLRDVNNLFGGPSYTPGGNYAVAGAIAAPSLPQGGVPGANLPQQVAAYLGATGDKADPNALYIVFIGGNDVRNAALYGTSTTGPAGITTGVAAEIGVIEALSAAGARNVLVPNVPNVGTIPEFAQDNPTLSATATAYSRSYDAQLSAGLGGLSLPQGTDLTPFNLYGYNAAIQANAAALGFTDTTDRCFTNTPLSAVATLGCGPDGQNVDSFTYWDAIHPTAPVQALWASGMLAALEGTPDPSPIPEPGSFALLGAGLLGIAGLRRRE